MHAPLWWGHPETLVCGVRGHVAGEAASGELRQCRRCDAWIEAGEAGEGIPRRGEELRSAIILRAIAVERAVHAVAFGLAALGLLVVRLDLASIQRDARNLTQNTLAGPAQAASRDSIQRFFERLLHLRAATLGTLAITAAVYCVLEGIEAVGLWLEKRWAEYLTALATAGFLPFELDSITHRVTAFRIGALIVNLVVLVYLVRSKHLFRLKPTIH